MPEYLKKLRELAGNLPILICGACIILENEKGEILLMQRSDTKSWGFPGGVVDINEAAEDAARREMFEETGLTAGPLELYGVFSGGRHYHVYPNGDEVSIVAIVYTCREYTGVPAADNTESIAVGFFPKDGLPENISPTCVPVLKKYLGCVGGL